MPLTGSEDLHQAIEKVTPLGTLILRLPKVGWGVNSMEEKQYLSPAVQVLELYSEGVLCASSGTEILEENGAYYLDITAKAFAKKVMIEWENTDAEPEDNFFDITDGKISIRILGEKEAILAEKPKVLSVFDVQ